MRKKVVASQASFEGHGGEIEREQSLDRVEEIALWTKPGYSELDNVRRLAWLGVKLCRSFLQRWLNLCEVGVEEVFFALTMLHSFAGVDLDSVTAPREMAALHSRQLVGEQDFSRTEDSPALSRNRSKFAIPWRTPWLYLVFLLLVWLLLF